MDYAVFRSRLKAAFTKNAHLAEEQMPRAIAHGEYVVQGKTPSDRTHYRNQFALLSAKVSGHQAKVR